MKFTVSLAAALLASTGLARSVRVSDAGGPGDDNVEQRLKITAFVINADGKPSVECWEIGDDFSPKATPNKQVSKASGNRVEIAGAAELSSVTLMTWAPYTPIWPPPIRDIQAYGDDVHPSQYCYYCGGYSCSSPNRGTVIMNCYGCNVYGLEEGKNDFANDDPLAHQYVFTPENGDNWFYFHDDRSGQSNYSQILAAEADNPPLTMTSFGNNGATVLNIGFDKFKDKKKLHNGSCQFGGVETPDEDSSKKHGRLGISLQVQEL